MLALDTGTISLHARGSIDIAGVVSGASLQNVADPTVRPTRSYHSRFRRYGPSSGVSLQSVAGDAIANSLEHGLILV